MAAARFRGRAPIALQRNEPLSLDLSGLHASDIQGRARAFQSLVGGGMPITEAASVTGLIGDD